MQRHMNSKHNNSDLAPFIPMSQEKCQRFQLVHPFTCDGWDDGIRKDCLGLIAVDTGLQND